jgi:hypothetical protein
VGDEVRSGRAQLRDLSAAQGVYEIDYTVHVSTRAIKNIGAPSTIRRIVTANIRSINGRKLKNGQYALEENGQALYQFEKVGADWRAI